jgi:Putative Flp pilus-assembly TadE/G-like
MRRNTEAGQAFAFAAVALVALLGFAGLAVDMGMLRYEKRLQQTAADAAAVAAAQELPYSTNYAAPGMQAAADNGFADNSGSATCTNNPNTVGCVTVTLNNPPTSGPHASCSTPCYYVEALVSVVQPTYFMRVFGTNSATVAARAVATAVSSSNPYSGGCIYVLGSTSGVGVTGSGTPTVNATQPPCTIYDNGSWTTNGAPVNIAVGSIGVAGTIANNGGGTVTCTNPGACPAGIAPVTDPLAGIQAPGVGTPTTWDPNNPVPGTYTGITVNNNQVVNFAAGTYVIDGGALQFNGGATVCNQVSAGCSATGTPNAGVTFYLTNGAYVQVNGNANVYLAAPSSGPYAGILFYQDPTDCSVATLNGTASSYYQGALYFPGNPAAGCNVQLNFGGNMTNAAAAYTVIITDDLRFFGTSNLTINSNYSSLAGGTFPFSTAILVE